jgi:tetratricopeptide (TPR) repeat protein
VPVREANTAEVIHGSSEFAASLGMAALKRLDLVVDGHNNLAYVRPKRTAAAAYQHNRLGAVFCNDPSLDDAIVGTVTPASPASEAGIRDGDILLAVAHHDQPNMRWDDPAIAPLLLAWKQPAGMKFDLTLRRQSHIYKTTIVLRDILKPAQTPPVPVETLESEVRWLISLGDAAIEEKKVGEAINNYREAVRLNGSYPSALKKLGLALEMKGEYSNCIMNYERALQLEPENAECLMLLAHVLSVCPDASLRDGKKALEYAHKVCELTAWHDAVGIDLLAMAYAASGDYSEAIKLEEALLRSSRTEKDRKPAQARLKLYRQNKPFHEE